MKVEIFTLCDAATADAGGKLNILGSFDRIHAASVPVTHPLCALAIKLRFERLEEGQKRVRIYDRWYDVKCQVRSIDGLSAHADSQELLKFLAPTLRKETQFYVVHGEADQADVFAERLIQNVAIDGRIEASIPLFVRSAPGQPQQAA